MGIIYTALGYYKSNENNPKKEITPFDVKLLMMSIISKLTLYKNKTTYSIKEKLLKILNDLKQNNINTASPKMETIITEEDLIDVYKLLITSATILHEKYQALSSNIECPKDLAKPLQNLIYASKHLSIEDGDNFRELMKYKFGAPFVENALDNKNFCIDYRIVNVFKRSKKSDVLIMLRLKQLAKQYNIKCEFPMDIENNQMNVEYIEIDNANPYSLKNSRLFEEFEKDKLNKKDFIIDKQKDVQNGFVLVESEFDMERLNNYCKINDIKLKGDAKGMEMSMGCNKGNMIQMSILEEYKGKQNNEKMLFGNISNIQKEKDLGNLIEKDEHIVKDEHKDKTKEEVKPIKDETIIKEQKDNNENDF